MTFPISQTLPFARAGLGIHQDWEAALDQALEPHTGLAPDVTFLFASASFQDHFSDLAQRAYERSGSLLMLGCSANGVIGPEMEAEEMPAISVLSLNLPGATLRPVRFTQSMLEADDRPDALRQRLGVAADQTTGWLVLADPFRMDGSLLVDRLNAAYPGVPVAGGLASPGPSDRQTWVFLNGHAYPDGGVGLALGGSYELTTVVSQGCEPIGEPWTITGVKGQWVETISNRPAIDVLTQTLATLPQAAADDAHHNLLAGIAANEYRDTFHRGDFLIRSIVGFERSSGALQLGARPRAGQTIQFQLRDAATADLDLTALLTETRAAMGDTAAVAGLLFSCNGRGQTLFGTPNHDVQAVTRRLGPMPVAGLFCAGEIGPVADTTFLHGFTASLALIVPV